MTVGSSQRVRIQICWALAIEHGGERLDARLDCSRCGLRQMRLFTGPSGSPVGFELPESCAAPVFPLVTGASRAADGLAHLAQ